MIQIKIEKKKNHCFIAYFFIYNAFAHMRVPTPLRRPCGRGTGKISVKATSTIRTKLAIVRSSTFMRGRPTGNGKWPVVVEKRETGRVRRFLRFLNFLPANTTAITSYVKKFTKQSASSVPKGGGFFYLCRCGAVEEWTASLDRALNSSFARAKLLLTVIIIIIARETENNARRYL